jgi:predicted AAA+ superfamily ATPase
MYIKRNIEPILLQLSKEYPVITVNGPRQSGKTTLVKSIFADKPYVNLELPDIRQRIADDPRGFLQSYETTGIIIDEVQRLPELLSYIQVYVDENEGYGRFILTGSNQGELHHAVSQSLAGRVAILTLLPFSIDELKEYVALTSDDYILHGFFPRVYAHHQTPLFLYRNYTQTYLEKDVRQIINIQHIDKFQRFLKVCAGRIGCMINKEALANEIGITVVTVTNWLSILQSSYIIFLLPPYFENFNKRITKTPKLYFTDVGLAAYLLGIHDITQLDRDPLRGFLFENLIIAELLKSRLNTGAEPELYYYRDNHQNEVDVVLRLNDRLVAIEIKSSATYNNSFARGLNYYAKIAKEKLYKQYLIYNGEDEFIVNNIHVNNFRSVKKLLDITTNGNL